MNHLLRGIAPLTQDEWKAIDDEARQNMRHSETDLEAARQHRQPLMIGMSADHRLPTRSLRAQSGPTLDDRRAAQDRGQSGSASSCASVENGSEN